MLRCYGPTADFTSILKTFFVVQRPIAHWLCNLKLQSQPDLHHAANGVLSEKTPVKPHDTQPNPE